MITGAIRTTHHLNTHVFLLPRTNAAWSGLVFFCSFLFLRYVSYSETSSKPEFIVVSSSSFYVHYCNICVFICWGSLGMLHANWKACFEHRQQSKYIQQAGSCLPASPWRKSSSSTLSRHTAHTATHSWVLLQTHTVAILLPYPLPCTVTLIRNVTYLSGSLLQIYAIQVHRLKSQQRLPNNRYQETLLHGISRGYTL